MAARASLRTSLALVVVLAWLGRPASASTCNRQTLRYFQDSIKFHLKTTAESTWYACSDEFAKHGSCCETESLKDFMEKAVESDSLRWNNALASVYLFRSQVLAKTGELAAKVKELFPQIDAAVRLGKVRQLGFDAARLLNKFLPVLTRAYYNNTEAQYRKEAQACFDEISTLRKNSLCLVCSGRSATFYNGERLTIKQRTCEGLAESCYNAFSFMFSVMGTSRALFDLVNALEQREVYPPARDPLPYNSKSRWPGTAVEALYSSKTFTQLQAAEKEAICEAFFNLGRPNDLIEGYDVELQRLAGIADRVQGLKVPAEAVKQRLLADATRIPVDVLTDIEPNGADLNSLNSRVAVKRVIKVANLDKAAALLALAAPALAWWAL